MIEWTVLTLTQPFATLVVLGLKQIETRGRATAHRGPLLIHAGLGPGYFGSEAALWDFCLSEPCRRPLAQHGIWNPGRLPRGEIIGSVDLRDCRPTAGPRGAEGTGPKYADWVHDLSAQERAFGDYTPGRWGYLLAEPRQLATPIKARGMPGFWRWRGEVVYAAS